MSAATIHKCEGSVWSGDSYHAIACGLNAKYEHKGHWYCKTHHPPTKEAKDEAKRAHWAAERAERQAAHEKAAAARAEMERRAELYDELLGVLQAIVASVPFGHSHESTRQRAVEAVAKATGATT